MKNIRRPIKLDPKFKALSLSLKLRATDVVPGKESWQNARLAMIFTDDAGKQVGPWPDVFSAKGTTDWINCSRIYMVPAGATHIHFEPAIFGKSGKAEFFDMELKGLTEMPKANLLLDPATGKPLGGLLANKPGTSISVKNGKVNISVEGSNIELMTPVPVGPKDKLIRITMKMRCTDVKAGGGGQMWILNTADFRGKDNITFNGMSIPEDYKGNYRISASTYISVLTPEYTYTCVPNVHRK